MELVGLEVEIPFCTERQVGVFLGWGVDYNYVELEAKPLYASVALVMLKSGYVAMVRPQDVKFPEYIFELRRNQPSMRVVR